MDRRGVLRIALGSGVSLLFHRIPSAEGADVGINAAPKVAFQEGTLSGGMFEGWKAVLASTGKAVRGTIYDPTSLGGAGFTGFRVRGAINGKALELELFELSDITFSNPIGSGDGRTKKKTTTTEFNVDGTAFGLQGGEQGGSMVSGPVPLKAKMNKELAGNFICRLTGDNGSGQEGEFTISLTRDGKFTIQDITSNTGFSAPQIAGRFGIAADGSIYTVMLLPPVQPGELPFDPSEVNILRPTNQVLQGASENLSYQLLLNFCLQAVCIQSSQLSGTVHEPNGRRDRPSSNAEVYLELENGTFVNSATSDAQGRYGFSRLAFGAVYKLRAVKSSFVTSDPVTIGVSSARINGVDLYLKSRPTGVAFSDDTFLSAAWESTLLEVISEGDPTVIAEQSPLGGNPADGPFRRSWVEGLAQHDVAFVAHMNIGAVHNPATQGALVRVTMSLDAIFFGSNKGAFECYCEVLIRQGSAYYQYSMEEPLTTQWANQRRERLQPDDFIRFWGEGPDRPDFSVNGAPIQFGYVVSHGSVSNAVGVDNWEVRFSS